MAFVLQKVREDPVPGVEFSRTAMVQFVQRDVLEIGRAANADLRFAEASVALEHAILRPLAEGGLEILDRGSLTGTYVNGKPIDRAVLADGDWIELGRHRLTIQIGDPGAPHTLFIRELPEEREAAAEPVVEASGGAAGAKAPRLEAAAIDHLWVYGLARRFLGKAALSVAGVALVVLAIAKIGVQGRVEAFRPGEVSAAHNSFATNCAACHAPFRGAQDERCITCHAGPEHQPREVAAPGCRECHVEHRFVPVLQLVDDAKCLDCHRQLEVSEGELVFARTVTNFATDHPEFALAVAAAAPGDESGEAAPRRVPLLSSEGRRGDRGMLFFGHSIHLKADLKGPDGPEQLDCLTCHSPTRTPDAIAPINYQLHCRRCHELTFGLNRDDVAPHTTPEKLHAFLLRTFVERQTSGGGGSAPPVAPLRVQRRLLPRGGGGGPASGLPELAVDQRVLRQVVETEINIYRSSCAKCHEVDIAPTPPQITPVAIPERWFPYASFTHQRHRLVACTYCHSGVDQSKDTADVLLPGIATCRECHGAGPDASEAGIELAAGGRDGEVTGGGGSPRTSQQAGATTRCVSCHLYHDASRTGEWSHSSFGSWEADSGFVGGEEPAN